MYDNFDLEKCVIVEEKYDEPDGSDVEIETATVKFIAEMVLRESGEKTSFMETSKFEKAKNSGTWLYLSGEIEATPGHNDDGEDEDTGHETEEAGGESRDGTSSPSPSLRRSPPSSRCGATSRRWRGWVRACEHSSAIHDEPYDIRHIIAPFDRHPWCRECMLDD